MISTAWTSQKLRDIFQTGQRLQVLLDRRRAWRRQGVREVEILAVDGEDMILSLPEPPLPPPLLGQALEITVLLEEGPGNLRRYAYPCSIQDLLPIFPAPDGPQPALVVLYPRLEDLYATSLRKARRVSVPPTAPLQLWLQDRRLELLDISAQGMRFRDGGALAAYAPGDEMRLRLVIHDEPQRVHGRVAAVNAQGDNLEISLELGILPLDAWTSLLEALQELEHAAQTRGAKA